MYEFTVNYSKTRQDGSRISFEAWVATVCAENEDEIVAIMAEEAPGASVDKITRGERIDDVDGASYE